MTEDARERRTALAWAFYDWGNSAFATTVMAGFFPIFFKDYWNAGVAATESTFRLGVANSIASLAIVVLAPILGSIGDAWGARKRFLLVFTALGVLSTAVLPMVAQGAWWLAALCYVLGAIGFSGGVTFYDSLLVFVAKPADYDRLSAFGYAVGYLGGGLLFALNVWMTLKPALFGLADAAEAVRLSFFTVAVWWAVFTVPLARLVHERPGQREQAGAAVVAGLRQLWATFHEIRALREVFLFLLAYWLYIDGVDTIVRMAVDYGLSLGFKTQTLIGALLVTQFVGFPASVAFGHIGARFGPRTGINIAIAVYAIVVIWATRMDHAVEFYAMAVVIGLVQGGIQSLSRSLYARLIPSEKTAEFFGFYNMLGKFAAVIGPVMVGWAALLTHSSRLAMLSLLILFFGGAVLLNIVHLRRRG